MTSREVLQFLVGKKILTINTTSVTTMAYKEYRTALRAVQRFLKWAGFLRGSKTGSVGISEEHKVKLCYYLRQLQTIRNSPQVSRLQEVFLDESYIHHHYRRDGYSMYYQGDNRYVQPKQPRKGKRCCFICGIFNDSVGQRAGIVNNSDWYFCPSGSKRNYRKNFNSATLNLGL